MMCVPHIYRPTFAETVRYAHITHDEIDKLSCAPSAAFLSVPGVIAGSGFTLADIPNQGARWDMVDSSVTTSGGNVTQVNDLVGTNHLIVETTATTGMSNAPADVSSDSVFNGRRSCDHVPGNSEALECGAVSVTEPYTLWMIGNMDGVASADHPFMITDGDVGFGFDNGTPDTWSIINAAYGDLFGSSTPDSNVSHSYVLIIDDGNTALHVDGSDEGISIPTTWYTQALGRIFIGYYPSGATYGAIGWTACGYTTDAMSADTIADIEAWRVANAAT